MKKMIGATRKVTISAASKETSEAFESIKNEVEDNFNYLLEGFEKLARDGQEKVAMDIMTSLNTAVEDAIAKVASAVAQ